MTYKYNFRTTNGAVCCQTNNPDHLCAACKGKALRPAGCPNRRALPTLFSAQGPLIVPWVVTPGGRSKR